MNIKIYQVDAFAQALFSGNPAAVCPLEKFLSDNLMQSIAAENNLSETAFIVQQSQGNYAIRWFSPTQEVSLCGHATLAAAYVVLNILENDLKEINFESISGVLHAKASGDDVELSFPVIASHEISIPSLIKEAMNHPPISVLSSDDYIVVLKTQQQIETLEVDQQKLMQLDRRGVVFTAPGDSVDFVSRVFHPKLGIGEDPVCGSAHCEIVPYWSTILEKNELSAMQLSARGGKLHCKLINNRVYLSGKAVLFMVGEIMVSDKNHIRSQLCKKPSLSYAAGASASEKRKPQETFAVIYRGYLKQGMEEKYQEYWNKIASFFINSRGAIGSCLHKTEDGMWIAYSKWPSKAMRDNAWPEDESVNQLFPEDIKSAIIGLKQCLDPEKNFPEIAMKVVNDFMSEDSTN